MPPFDSMWQQHDRCRLGVASLAPIGGWAVALPAAHTENVQQQTLGPSRVEKTSQRVMPARHILEVYRSDLSSTRQTGSNKPAAILRQGGIGDIFGSASPVLCLDCNRKGTPSRV